jgi:DNA-binding NarL/FixJ family response regulator
VSAASPQARVLLADDHTVVRQGLRLVLEQPGDLLVVAEADDGIVALDVARRRDDLDLAVLDVAMPRMTGLEAAREIRRIRPGMRLVMLSMHDDEEYFFEAVRAGASGYVLKSAADRDLVEACRAALRGEPYIHPGAGAALLRDWLARADDEGGGMPERLTHRERQVLKLVAESHTSQEIAEALTISLKTVESHRASILHKLGMSDRVELTRYAIRSGLVDP